MMQIDQDPGSYRVEASDGSWRNRMNRPLARKIGLAGLVFVGVLLWRFSADGGAVSDGLVFAVAGLLSGLCLGMSVSAK